MASAILEKEPEPITSTKPMTPATLDHAIRRCLAKDPEDRWQTAHDAMVELSWMAEGDSAAGIAAPAARRRGSRDRTTVAVAILLAFMLGAAAFLRR